MIRLVIGPAVLFIAALLVDNVTASVILAALAASWLAANARYRREHRVQSPFSGAWHPCHCYRGRDHRG